MTKNVNELAGTAIQELCYLQTVIDERDPIRAPIAQRALELATSQLVETGMLDILITIAARQLTAVDSDVVW